MSKKILELCLSPDLGGLELFSIKCFEYFKQKTFCKMVVSFGKKIDGYIEKNNDLLI